MKKILSIGAIALVAIIVYSCSKDQQAVRRLSDGEWEITAQSVDGVALPDSAFAGATYTFEKCRVSDGPCDGSLSQSDPTKGEVTFPFTYEIKDDGETLIINLDLFGITDTSESTIIENERDRFVWESTNADGSVTQTTIEKK